MDRNYLFVVLSGLLAGLIVFGGAILVGQGLSAYEIALFSLIPAVVLVLPYVVYRKKAQINPRLFPLLFLLGIVGTIGGLCQYGAVALKVPVAVIVLLLYTQPLWTLLFTRLFLQEKITLLKIASALIVLVGVAILVNPFSLAAYHNLVGILVALLGGLCLSGWVVVSSVLSKKGNDIFNTKFYEAILVFLMLLITYPLASSLIANPQISRVSLNHPLALIIGTILFGAFCSLLSNLLYYQGVKTVPTVDAGIIMLLEPVVAALLSAIFLHQPLTLNLMIGGALILLANYLVIAKAAPSA